MRSPRFAPSLTLLFVASLGALLPGCFAAREIRPVGEGQFAAGLSVGGPVFTNLGVPIPTPLATAYGRYGVTDRTDVDLGLTFPTIGAAALDAGAAHLVLEQDGAVPALMLGGRVSFWANLYGLTSGVDSNGRPYELGPRVFEEGFGYTSWKLSERTLGYAGLDLFAQIEQAIVRPTLLAGIEYRFRPELGLQLEAKDMAFLTNQHFAAVSFIGPAGYGALGINIAFNVYPGAMR